MPRTLTLAFILLTATDAQTPKKATVKTETTARLTESAAAVDACGKAMLADLERQIKLAGAGLRPRVSEEPEACTEAVVAKLTNGTRLEILTKPEECDRKEEPLLRVKVLSGKNEGKVGCLSSKEIAPE